MFLRAIFSLLSLGTLCSALKFSNATKWPFAPFTTSGRWILDAAGHNVTYAGVNWPGAADTMIPEGLQYASIASVVSKIKNLGMNVIRLTYAIELVDDIYAGGDNTMKTSFINALGEANGTAVFEQVVKFNPQFSENTTRLEAFDAVAAECFKQQIYVHLDNHVSKAIWCCNGKDGNSWFGDAYFNISNWNRGLSFMARHGASWGNLMSVALRNELRPPTNNPGYRNVVPATKAINEANAEVLIFLSGIDYDTLMGPISTSANLGGGFSFRKEDFSYANKLVIELHNYETTTNSCSTLVHSLYSNGYNAMDPKNPSVVNVMPVVLTEFGHHQDDATYASVYSTCLKSFLTSIHGGWMIWALIGSYYIREGSQDSDDTWGKRIPFRTLESTNCLGGLLNHNWTEWRDPNGIDSVIVPMIAGTKTF